jgi:hypothetical protein
MPFRWRRQPACVKRTSNNGTTAFTADVVESLVGSITMRDRRSDSRCWAFGDGMATYTVLLLAC